MCVSLFLLFFCVLVFVPLFGSWAFCLLCSVSLCVASLGPLSLCVFLCLGLSLVLSRFPWWPCSRWVLLFWEHAHNPSCYPAAHEGSFSLVSLDVSCLPSVQGHMYVQGHPGFRNCIHAALTIVISVQASLMRLG